MDRRLIAAIVAGSILTGCTSPGAEPDRGDTALAANVEAFAARLAASDDFSGVVLLARHGRPLLRRGFGLADRKAGRPNTPETPFALSSVSKMFTAVTIAKLVERNQLSFDATLGSLLPEYPSVEAREQVTVRHLLTMSSGIPDLFRVPAFWSEIQTIKAGPDFWKYFATAPLEFRPGTRWAYSNSNFLLLGAIIERRAGRPFIPVVEEEVFRPLGLTHTRYEVDPSQKPALGYTNTPPAGGSANSDRWHPAWVEPKPGDDFVPASPMGGGYSTVDDLARFADALMANRILRRETTARVLTAEIEADYGGRDGYGFETRTMNGVRTAGHRGSLAGSSNNVEFYPDLGYVVVVLGNTDSGTQSIAAHARASITSPDAPAVSSKLMPDGRHWMIGNLNLDTRLSYCHGNAELNCHRYGRLYPWEEARQACPGLGDGWRLPTNDEWRKMAKHFGGVRDDSDDTGKSAYQALLSGGRSGFEAVLGGNRSQDGQYERLEAHGFYWTASETDAANAWFYNFGKGGLMLNRHRDGEKGRAFSVRCVRE